MNQKVKAKAKAEQKEKIDLFKVRPTHDRIVVKPNPAESKSAGGIIIPDTAKEKPNIGVVVNATNGHYEGSVFVEHEVKVNDKVIYGKWAGTPVEVDGDEYLIMRQDDVLAII